MRGRPSAIAIAAACLIALLGCQSSLRPVSDRSKLRGDRADELRLFLAAPFSFRHGLDTYTVPAGRYAAAMEDDSGVYFRAPAEIFAYSPLAAASVYSGGLYLPLDGSSPALSYIVVRSQLRFLKLPSDFQYSLER